MAKQPSDDWEVVEDEGDWEPLPTRDIPPPDENTDSDWLVDTWDAVNKPLTDYLPDWLNPSKRVADRIAKEPGASPEDWNIPFTSGAKWKGLRQGIEQGAADTLSSFTSPLNAATMAASAGSVKIPQLGTVARALSAPVAFHGGKEVLRPDASMSERGMGLAELAGGLAGMQHLPAPIDTPIRKGALPTIAKDVVTPPAGPGSVVTPEPLFKTTKPYKPATPPVETESIMLPKDLAGAKPRYNIGDKQYEPTFSNDLDKSLFIIAQKNPSKRDADYLSFAMRHTGLDEAAVRDLATQTRERIKFALSTSQPGVVKIPPINKFKPAPITVTADVPAMPLPPEVLAKLDEFDWGPDAGKGSDPQPGDFQNLQNTEPSAGISPEDQNALRQARVELEKLKASYGPDSEEYQFALKELSMIAREIQATPVGKGSTTENRPRFETDSGFAPEETGLALIDESVPAPGNNEGRPRNIEQEDYNKDWDTSQQNTARYEGRNINDVHTPLTPKQQQISDSYAKIREHSDKYNQEFTDKENLLPEGQIYKPPPGVQEMYELEQKVLHDRHRALVDKLDPLEKPRLPYIDVQASAEPSSQGMLPEIGKALTPEIMPMQGAESFPPGLAKNRLDELRDKARSGNLTGDELAEARILDSQMRRGENVAPPIPSRTLGTPPSQKVRITPKGEVVASSTPEQKLTFGLENSKPLSAADAEAHTKNLRTRIKHTGEIGKPGEPGYVPPLSATRGTSPVVEMEPLRNRVSQTEVNDLNAKINAAPLDDASKAAARVGLEKLLDGEVPTNPEVAVLQQVLGVDIQSKLPAARAAAKGDIPDQIKVLNRKAEVASMAPPIEKEGMIRQVLGVQRGLLTAYDVSAPGRQGLGLIHKKAFWTSLDDMFKSWGSQKAFDTVKKSIDEHPSGYFQKGVDEKGKPMPSLAERAKLSRTNMGDNPEEVFRSHIARYIPGMEASNRAYVAFLDKLRTDTFVNLVDKAKKQGKNPETDDILLGEIGHFINNATGRGHLGVLEKNVRTMNDIFFAPKLMASRIHTYTQVFNPKFYNQLDPMVRTEALKSMLAIAGTGMAIGQVTSYVAGAEVDIDPRNSDFLKMKIGNTRIDPFGGHQQYLVGAARLAMGTSVSSTTGKETDLTAGRFGMPTRADVVTNLFKNKLAPLPSLVWSWMENKEFDGESFEIKNALMQRVLPIITQDLYKIYNEDPKLLPAGAKIFAGVGAAVGMGVQTYGR